MEVDRIMSQQLLAQQQPRAERILELFVQDCIDRQLTPETIRHYKTIAKKYVASLSEKGLSPIEANKHTIHDFIRDRRSKAIDQKTVENELSAIAGFYDFLVFEDFVVNNPVPGVRKRYLRRYKEAQDADAESPRKLISIEEMSLLINSVLDTRDKAILTLLAKTGVRRGELIAMDITDINWVNQSIALKRKQFKKRSNRTVYFDDETARLLKRWLGQRIGLSPTTPSLFIGEHGERLKRNGVYSMVLKYAARVRLHDFRSDRPEDHFSPHCFRHWFTTHLRRAGMDREFIKALRGDRRREAIDIYDHIDQVELRRAYLAFIPQLGV